MIERKKIAVLYPFFKNRLLQRSTIIITFLKFEPCNVIKREFSRANPEG